MFNLYNILKHGCCQILSPEAGQEVKLKSNTNREIIKNENKAIMELTPSAIESNHDDDFSDQKKIMMMIER